MLAVGVTVVEAPEETAPTPLSIEPEPFMKTAVRVTLAPSWISVAEAAKVVIVGVDAGATSMVTERVTVAPALFVTVNVKVVVDDGVTVVEAPEVTAPTPLSIEPEPSLKTAVKVALAPSVIAVADATKLVIVGASSTTIFIERVTISPALFVTVNV